MKTTFDSSPDALVKATTAAIVLLVGTIGVLFLVASVTRPAPLGSRMAVAGAGVVCFAILSGTYHYCPRRFVLTKDALVVKRLAGDVEIALRSIRKVEELAAEFRPSWRTFGSGGLFGVFGRFASSAGSVTIYGRRSRGGVLLETDAARIVVRPDEPSELIASISAARVG